jgi:hypothetical protein
MYEENMKAVWQECFDISEKHAAPFICLEDAASKFLLNTGTLLQGPYFVLQPSFVTSCHYSAVHVGS